MSALRRGLTLFELVIVLAILAAVTAAVSVATDHILMQRRFEMTQKSLDAARIAILGGSDQDTLVSTPDIAGFVADVGRLPLAIDADASAEGVDLQPVELWAKPADVIPYSIHVSAEDPAISLAGGWRGPYLRLPPGSGRMVDGWGRSPVLLTRNGLTFAPAVAGQEILELGSYGSDGVPGTTGDAWSNDLGVTLHNGANPPALQTVCPVSVRVWERNALGDLVPPQGNGSLVVKLYFQHATIGVASYAPPAQTTPQAELPPFDMTTYEVVDGGAGEVKVPLFPMIGPKVLRAYWTGADSSVRKSQPLSIHLVQGGPSQFDLILPPYTPVPPPETPTP